MQIKGYVGICGACFEPIKEGEEIKFREHGSFFHKNCSDTKPNSYYLALERIRGQYEQGVKANQLLNELEDIFKIPLMNDEEFNQANTEVMELYREISDSRF